MTDLIPLIPLAGLAFLLAGAVKGIAGIGLPTAALGVMTLAIDPRVAISLILVPMLATNTWQMIFAGNLARTFRRYWVFALCLTLGVSATVFFTASADDRFLLGALGFVILLFVWLSWAGWIPPLPDRFDTAAQVLLGLFAGGIGGLTGTWAAAIAIYLTTRRVDKDEFIRATGFLIFVGSIPLLFSYLQLGFATLPLLGLSFAMLVPAFVGMWLGTKVRDRLSPEGFTNAILGVFVILAANLLRRAFL